MAEEPAGEWPETGAGGPGEKDESAGPAGAGLGEGGKTGIGREVPVVEFWVDTNLFGMFLAQCASIPNLIVESYVFEIHMGKAQFAGNKDKEKIAHLIKDLETGWFARFKAACGAKIPNQGVIPVAILVTLTCPVMGANFAGRVLRFPLTQSNSALISLMQKTPPEMRQQFVKVKFENGSMSIKFCNQGGGLIVLNNPHLPPNGGGGA